MGLIKKIFGKNSQKIPDGLWMKNYRECDWVEAFSIQRNEVPQIWEIGTDSCFEQNGNLFFILRVSDFKQETFGYATACLPNGWEDEIHIIVDRAESSDGKTIKKDDWTKGRVLKETKVTGVSKAIALAKNYAGLYNFKNTPPYVVAVMIGMAHL